MVSTIIFVLLCAMGATFVWVHRTWKKTGTGIDPHSFALAWPFFLTIFVTALLWSGNQVGYGNRLSLTVSELRLPLEDVGEDGTYFVVGPDVQISDLVIGPYADTVRSLEAYRPEFDRLIEIKRSNGAWEVCGRTVPVPDNAEANLPGMQVSFDGEPVAGLECRPLTATAVTALVSRLDPGGGGQDRRHLYLSLESDHVRIGLKGDEYLTKRLGRCPDPLDPGRPELSDRLRLAPAGLHERDLGYRVPDNLFFDQLGQGGERPFLDPEKLGPVDDMVRLCSASLTPSVSWPGEGGSARLIMSSTTNSLAWWIIAIIFASSLYTLRVCRNSWRSNRGRTEAALVIALQWLLSLRILVALGGIPNDPGLAIADILWPPLAAFVCVPAIAIALLCPHADGVGRRLGLTLAQIPVLYAFIAWQLDWQWPGGQEIGLAIIAALTAGLRTWTTTQQPLIYFFMTETGRLALTVGSFLWDRAQRGVRWAIARIEGLGAPKAIGSALRASRNGLQRLFLQQADDDTGSASFGLFQLGLLLAIVTVAVRTLLGAVGQLSSPPIFQERFVNLPLIENLPISVIYAPLSIIAIALMIVGFRRNPNLTKAFLLVGTFVGLFLWVGFFVRDLGIILIFAIPAGVAIAKLAAFPSREGGLRMQLTRLTLLFPVISPFLMLGTYYALNAKPVPPPYEDLSGHMAASAQWDANLVRLQRFIDADFLIDVGNTSALEVLDQAAQLEPLTSELIGEGYMTPSGVVPPVRGYQYSDNLLAVLVAWPFGRIGLIALLGAFLVVLLSLRPIQSHPAGRSWLDETSYLAAATLFWSGAYMALANLNLAPFTGRNFYFLAARSTGDLIEALILILLTVAAALAVQQPRDVVEDAA